MRIKWTSLPNVTTTRTPAGPSAGNAQPERAKPEAMNERESEKRDKKKKSERSFDWLRRSR